MASIPKAIKESITELPVETPPEFVYIEIPDTDMLGFKFSGVGHNLNFYPPGVHKVSPDVAADIRERLKAAQAQDLRMLTSKIDSKALLALAEKAAKDGIGYVK